MVGMNRSGAGTPSLRHLSVWAGHAEAPWRRRPRFFWTEVEVLWVLLVLVSDSPQGRGMSAECRVLEYSLFFLHLNSLL